MAARRPRKRNSDRRLRRSGLIKAFLQQYERKHYPNIDPNDRRYDRDIERKVQHMSPEELDRLIREDEDD